MYKTVLVATDGSETAGRAVTEAIDLAKLCGATLHIANVYRKGDLRVPSMMLGLPEGIDRGSVAETQVASEASRAKVKGVKVKTHVEMGDPVDEILNIATKIKADVIVVGNKGMRGSKRILGSVPNGVAHRAPCAVLIINTV